MQAFTLCISAIAGFSPNISPLLCTTVSKTTSSGSMPSWIAGGIRLGLATA
jgi:hypothetical protein